jgi:hypothetical protein
MITTTTTRTRAAGIAAFRRGSSRRTGSRPTILDPATIVFGHAAELPRAVGMGASWLVNLVIAEGIIRQRGRSGPTRTRPATASTRGVTK